MRSLILCLILLLGATSAAAESTADRARALFEKGSYAEAAALARQVFAKKPHGRAADGLRVLLCEAKRAGEDVGESAEPSPVTAPLEMGGKVRRPEKFHGPNPQVGGAGEEGDVIVQTVIDQDGCVREDFKILQGVNELADQAVIRALRQWTFRPASLHGKPVATYYALTVHVRFD